MSIVSSVVRQFIDNFFHLWTVQLLIPTAAAASWLSFRLTLNKRVAFMGGGFFLVLFVHIVFRFLDETYVLSSTSMWAWFFKSESMLLGLSVLVTVVSLAVLARYIAPTELREDGN